MSAILGYISDDNPDAALGVLDASEDRVARLSAFPKQGREGRVPMIREVFVRPNYVVVYAEEPSALKILRVLHAAQIWP